MLKHIKMKLHNSNNLEKKYYIETKEYINNMGNNRFSPGDIEINLESYIFAI